jgi:16S rRNA (adenine1518-N6/adenine1519-N6)-dimethyltransferase
MYRLAKLIKPLINPGGFTTLAGEINRGKMEAVRPKKRLGQHFLRDRNIAQKIVSGLILHEGSQVLEIGPGMGILTGLLLDCPGIILKMIEIDHESVEYLKNRFAGYDLEITEGDFLEYDLSALFNGQFSVIGNFPYHISSQIFFRVLEFRNRIPELVGMVQKEVAQRICSAPGSRTYGILSVLLQAYYHTEYLFTVHENVFVPPPAVKSAVIRLRRNERSRLVCDESNFVRVVKTAFNQRRKVLSNALKPLTSQTIPAEFAGKRAEELSPHQFETLTCQLYPS